MIQQFRAAFKQDDEPAIRTQLDDLSDRIANSSGNGLKPKKGTLGHKFLMGARTILKRHPDYGPESALVEGINDVFKPKKKSKSNGRRTVRRNRRNGNGR